MVEYFWSYELGKFLDKTTGTEVCLHPDGRRMCSFSGDQREWNETLIEVIYDVSGTLLWQGVPMDVVQGLSLFTGSTMSLIMQTSVIYGHRAGHGVMLEAYVSGLRDPMDPDIDFVDPRTGELFATVHVLDLPCAV